MKLKDVMFTSESSETSGSSLAPLKFYGKQRGRMLRVRAQETKSPPSQQKKMPRRKSASKRQATRSDKVIANKKTKVEDGESIINEEIRDEAAEVEAGLNNEESQCSYQVLVGQKRQEQKSFWDIFRTNETEELVSALAALQPKKRTSISGIVNEGLMQSTKPVAIRKSLRLQNKPTEPDYGPKVLNFFEETIVTRETKPHGPLPFSDVTLENNKNPAEELQKDFDALAVEMPLEKTPLSFKYYKRDFDSMKITASSVAKLVVKKVYCLSVHPCPVKVLLSAGSILGQIALWDMNPSDKEGGLYLFEPHADRVTCLEFNPDRPWELYSCSFDGTVRCGDIPKGVFDEVYCGAKDEDDEVLCSSFDFTSPSSLVVGIRDGTVAVVDRRTGNVHGETHHQTHNCTLKCVSTHPVQRSYFIASGNNGIVSLWDLRHLKKKPIAEMAHQRSVSSAYFSPVSGNSILTTSMDDTLCIFDSSYLTKAISLKKAIRHNNHTGRWLAPFRAVWLPNTEEAFVVGSMLQPRRIEVYESTGKLVHNFAGEDLGSVCSINAFHPKRPLLAGGNSSGRVHVFMKR